MLATQEDVRDCYRTFLQREPENERAVLNQLAGGPSVIQLAANIVASAEYKSRAFSRSHLSMSKCFERDYLTVTLDIRSKLSIYTNHYRILSEYASATVFDELTTDHKLLLALGPQSEYAIKVCAPQNVNNEGELTAWLEVGGKLVYQIGFSFAPGHVFGFNDETVVFITRMQGGAGTKAFFQQSARDWNGAAPCVLLFQCVVGIAAAIGAQRIVGVSARNQICYRPEYYEAFKRSYDDFFLAHGFEVLSPAYFHISLVAERAPKPDLSLPHRRRALRRRRLRDNISRLAQAEWESWRHNAAR